MTTSRHAARDADNFDEMARRVGTAVERQLKANGIAIATLAPSVIEPAPGNNGELHLDVTFADGLLTPFRLAYWALCEENLDAAAKALVKAIARATELRPRIGEFIDFAHARIAQHLDGTTIRLVRMGLAPFDAKYPPRVHDITIEIVLEGLDAALRTSTTVLHTRRRHYLVKELRSRATTQKKRQRQLDRLARLGAVVEVSAPAEAMIAERGLDVEQVARELLALDPGQFGSRHSSDETLAGLVLEDGVIQFFGDVGPKANAAALLGDQLRIFERISDERRAELQGQPAANLFAHPAVLASGRIASIRLRESATDITLRGVKRRALRLSDLEEHRAAA